MTVHFHGRVHPLSSFTRDTVA